MNKMTWKIAAVAAALFACGACSSPGKGLGDGDLGFRQQQGAA